MLGGATIPLVIQAKAVNKKRIIVQKQLDGSALSKKIPKKVYKYNRKVGSALKSLEKEAESNQNIVSTGRKLNPDKSISGQQVTQLVAWVPKDRHKENVPDEINGIPISKPTYEQPEPASDEHCENIRDFDNVPGGVQIENDRGFTSAYRVTDGTSNYMLTVAHGAEDKDDFSCGNGKGEDIDQHDQYIGSVKDANKTGDWAIIPRTSDSDISSFDNAIQWTKPDPDNRRDIGAWYTKYGIETEVLNDDGSGELVHQQGINSGHSSGYINYMEVSITYGDCDMYGGFSTDGEGLKGNFWGLKGDSGGPVFVEKDNLVLVGYFIAYETNQSDDSWTCDLWDGEGSKSWTEYNPVWAMPTYYLDNNQGIYPT